MRRSKSAHKKANSGRRQTNCIQMEQSMYYIFPLIYTEFAFYQIHKEIIYKHITSLFWATAIKVP